MKIDINEVRSQRALNPTSITLGEYVVNPYRGCYYGCEYCYAKKNKTSLKDERIWGEYVDVRSDIPRLLESEIARAKPLRILIGSTTECFSPVESEYRITEKIINVLNRNNVKYSIMTRSPLICEYIPIIKKELCEVIYFSVNSFDKITKDFFEFKSASYEKRYEAIDKLLFEGIKVIPYFSPYVPYVSDEKFFLNQIKKHTLIREVEIEAINFNLVERRKLIDYISKNKRSCENEILDMLCKKNEFETFWNSVRDNIAKQASALGIKVRIHLHGFREFFQNKY